MNTIHKSGGSAADRPIKKITAQKFAWLSNVCAGLMIGACALGGHSNAAEVVVKGSHFKEGGISYFRGNAENVQLGSYGDKKTPATSMNYLSVDDVIPLGRRIKAEKVQVLDINTTKTSKHDLFANLSDVTKVFGVSADVAWKKVKSRQLKLVKFVIANNDIMAAANRSSKSLRALKARGKGARIANQLFVILSAESAEAFERSSSVDVSATNGKIKLSAGGSSSSSGNKNVTLSKGSTFAYGLVKLHWAKGKKRIESVDPDQYGLN